jgi:dUTP pyrophosphatase
MVAVKIKLLSPLAKTPFYAKHGDVGMDITSVENYYLAPREYRLFKTGIALEIPEWYEVQVRPRSGLAFNNGITVLNSPGTIDSGYRGEVGVILINHGHASFQISVGMRIAQLVVNKLPSVELEIVEHLSNSERGESGFGSTGTGERHPQGYRSDLKVIDM